MEVGTPETIGESNKRLILAKLRQHGNMSRADLCRGIGLSFPAISSNVKYLLENDYIREVGAGDNSFGRKSTLLCYNGDRGYVVGMDIGRTRIRCMLTDLMGNVRASGNCNLDGDPGEEAIVRQLLDLAARMTAEGKVDKKRVLCFCIGLPGLVRENKVYLAPFFTDLSLDKLTRSLKRHFRADVLYENGVNLGAKGEHRYGLGTAYSDLAYVSYGVGLGAALILGGKLYTGPNGAAGEIGFMLLGPDGGHRNFGEIGVLESALAEHNLGDLFTGAAGEQVVRKNTELRRAARQMGMALVNLAAVTNPMALIISGRLGKAVGELFQEEWQTLMADNLPFPPEVVLSNLDNRETMLGAISTAIERVEAAPITSEHK